ncbi:hypothetical protein ACW0JT_04430 [Arthrobacter sp. SA17]
MSIADSRLGGTRAPETTLPPASIDSRKGHGNQTAAGEARRAALATTRRASKRASAEPGPCSGFSWR